MHIERYHKQNSKIQISVPGQFFFCQLFGCECAELSDLYFIRCLVIDAQPMQFSRDKRDRKDGEGLREKRGFVEKGN